MIRSGFAMLATYDFALVIVVIVAAVLGYHAPDIGNWVFAVLDFG